MPKPKAATVLNKVLARITPSARDSSRMHQAIDRVMQATEDVIKPLHLKHTLAGSFLRDTWLSDKLEFDVFILFKPDVARERLEQLGLEIGKKVVTKLKGKHEIAYAEHPYVRAVIDDFAVDFVPCYEIKDPGRIQSAVDRTPHHNRYIKRKLNGRLSPQVRLLKQFCKGIGVYGSDLRVEGFSGYLTELLIIRYKTLQNLMADAVKWEAGRVFIDLERHHGGRAPNFREKYPGQPMVVIDPVDRNRNVAAAVSPANFELFKQSCKEFLQNPSERFFRTKRVALRKSSLMKEIRRRDTRFLAVSFRRPRVVDDVIFPQLRRSARRMAGMLSDEDFRVLDSGIWCDRSGCVILLELEASSLPATKRVVGPPIFAKRNSDQFVEKYKGKSRLWVEGKNWVTEIKRQHRNAKDLLSGRLKGDAKKLATIGIASHVAKGLKSGLKFITEKEIVDLAARNKDFAVFLTQYFKKKII